MGKRARKPLESTLRRPCLRRGCWLAARPGVAALAWRMSATLAPGELAVVGMRLGYALAIMRRAVAAGGPACAILLGKMSL